MVDLDSPELTELLHRLTLEEKVKLLTGRDFWTTWPVESIGLRRMLLSDGPSGVRGEAWDERDPSLNLPSATALSSSWDTGIAYRYGVVLAEEARRKGVDVVLGPTINLHRSPLGGRHFEAFSEDPVLTADLAVAYVRGLQDHGVGATPKHYVANDYETERFTASTDVSERALRELYLLAFEQAAAEAWLVMSSYNAVNGVTATEHDLLRIPLKTEWGFDGVVVGDWTAVRSLASASAAQDLVMPGPHGPWGDALVAAVREGRVAESIVDDKVRRVLLLAARVGALDGFTTTRAAGVDGVAFAREAAVEGTVLLANDGVLPLDPAGLRRVAVIGHNARDARTQGGGSATVRPATVVTPLDALRAALPNAEVTYSLGAVVRHGVAEFPRHEILNPATGEPGMLVRFLDADGGELYREDRLATALVYFGGDAPVATAATIELSVTWTRRSRARCGWASPRWAPAGSPSTASHATRPPRQRSAWTSARPCSSHRRARSGTVGHIVAAGVPVDVRVEFDLPSSATAPGGVLGITVGVEPVDTDSDALIASASRAAEEADVAVVVVGTSSQVESEGFDRQDLALPGRQDDLVRAVAATGTPTVVVVNSGAPVLLPWRDEVSALLVPYFGGQETGNALADVLLGRAEPGGRLPTTWPARQEDVPVLDVTPVDGELHYDEGIHIGYRAWLKAGAEPAYPFGFGLGYTTWRLSDLTATPTEVSVSVTNEGPRAGKQVVQAYLSRAESTVDRPVRWLAGHAVARARPGETTRVTIPFSQHAFADWRPDGWHRETGPFTVTVGTSVTDLPFSDTILIAG